MSDAKQILADFTRMENAQKATLRGPQYSEIYKAVAEAHRVSIDHVRDLVALDTVMLGAG